MKNTTKYRATRCNLGLGEDLEMLHFATKTEAVKWAKALRFCVVRRIMTREVVFSKHNGVILSAQTISHEPIVK